jgi:hypothetical protein
MVVQREQPKPRQQVQQIQIPASMAGQQLVVAQMPDGRQQIFALQGNQGTPVQLVQQGGQIMQQVLLELETKGVNFCVRLFNSSLAYNKELN